MTHPGHVLPELGDEIRHLARQRQVARQVGPDARWTMLERDLVAMADRCAEWGWSTRAREDPVTLEAEARALLAAARTRPQPPPDPDPGRGALV